MHSIDSATKSRAGQSFKDNITVAYIALHFKSRKMDGVFLTFTTTSLLRYIEVFQSNRKYWYAQEGVPMYDEPRGGPPMPPRGRPRPAPYSKPYRGGGGGGYSSAPPRGGSRMKYGGSRSESFFGLFIYNDALHTNEDNSIAIVS